MCIFQRKCEYAAYARFYCAQSRRNFTLKSVESNAGCYYFGKITVFLFFFYKGKTRRVLPRFNSVFALFENPSCEKLPTSAHKASRDLS